MEYRNSSNSQHLRQGAAFGVDSSHGVQLSGGSTGGRVDAVGDDNNITLSLAGKGTGPTVVGNSSSPVFVGGSTAPFLGFIRASDTAVATPNFATTNAMVMETTHTLAGVNTSHFLIALPRNFSTDCALLNVFHGTSNAGEVHCRFLKASTLTVSATTGTIDFLAIRF